MSQLTFTTICIAYSDKIGITVEDCNDSASIKILKNDTTMLNITLSRNQLDLLMDAAEDYLDGKPILCELNEFGEE